VVFSWLHQADEINSWYPALIRKYILYKYVLEYSIVIVSSFSSAIRRNVLDLLLVLLDLLGLPDFLVAIHLTPIPSSAIKDAIYWAKDNRELNALDCIIKSITGARRICNTWNAVSMNATWLFDIVAGTTHKKWTWRTVGRLYLRTSDGRATVRLTSECAVIVAMTLLFVDGVTINIAG
jgi:hypothetical protein